MNRVFFAVPALGFLIGFALIGGGCASSGVVSVTDVERPQVADRLTLNPGDEIEIKFFYAPELNERQVVRPDGKISLQLIGDVMAYGRTPEELQGDLRKRYRTLIDKPEVSVIVRDLQSRVVFVGGAVLLPGRISMPGTLTALGAIMQAGGFNTATADEGEVFVIRHSEGKRIIHSLNLKDALRGRNYESFLLEPQDIVLVPRSAVANVNQWIDQHINRMVPQFGFTYTETSADGRSRVGIDTLR